MGVSGGREREGGREGGREREREGEGKEKEPALTAGWSWRAMVAAFTKGDMNPSLTLCFFSKFWIYVVNY